MTTGPPPVLGNADMELRGRGSSFQPREGRPVVDYCEQDNKEKVTPMAIIVVIKPEVEAELGR